MPRHLLQRGRPRARILPRPVQHEHELLAQAGPAAASSPPPRRVPVQGSTHAAAPASRRRSFTCDSGDNTGGAIGGGVPPIEHRGRPLFVVALGNLADLVRPVAGHFGELGRGAPLRAQTQDLPPSLLVGLPARYSRSNSANRRCGCRRRRLAMPPFDHHPAGFRMCRHWLIQRRAATHR